MTTVHDVRRLLDEWYPPALAESWDRPGLVCGDPQAPATPVGCALEATDAVVDAAQAAGVRMLVVHHPLLLHPVSSIAADTAKGRVLHRLVSSGIALMSAHTNADAARGGVNDVLAGLLGVGETTPLSPAGTDPLDLWGLTCPPEDAGAVREAVGRAGAGALGDYRDCSFSVSGTGRFTPLPGARPARGRVGTEEVLTEERITFVAPRSRRREVHAALVAAHPYEEPAFDVVESHSHDLVGTGIGRVGTLAEPMSLAAFTRRVADRLPRTVWGVRAAGDPDRQVRTVALCSGAGDSLMAEASASGADVYLTSDLRHHPADEHLRRGGPALVDVAHWASEFPWCPDVAARLEAAGVEARVLDVRTDPWTISVV